MYSRAWSILLSDLIPSPSIFGGLQGLNCCYLFPVPVGLPGGRFLQEQQGLRFQFMLMHQK